GAAPPSAGTSCTAAPSPPARRSAPPRPPCQRTVPFPPMPDVQAALARAVRAALDGMGVGPDVEAVIEPSGRPEFGDWSTPAPLRAARVLRRAPLQIA